MRNAILAAGLPLALAACAVIPAPSSTSPAPPEDGPELAWAGVGEQVMVNGLAVTPLEVLEDSRCPANVQCVWAGQVRIRVSIGFRSEVTIRDLTSGNPEPVANGTLELVDVRPAKTSEAAIAPGDYRFGFRLMGRL